MANFTQKAILQQFEEMLTEMPFDKITVSALVSRCGISPNTFYYHYRDIYDLLSVWIGQKKEWFLPQTATLVGWPAKLKAAMHLMADNSAIVYHLFNSLSRQQMEQYIFNSVEEMFYNYIKESLNNPQLPEETLRTISNFCCYSLLGFLLKFIWNRMDGDIDAAVDGLSELFDGTIEYITKKAMTASSHDPD